MDFRFAVNTYAPYLLTKRLLPTLKPGSRIINVASAAQAPVDLDALAGRVEIVDQFNAYAQSKLALIMWTRVMAQSAQNQGSIFVAVNPGSLLGTKMVNEGFGTAGKDAHIGSDILDRAALSDEFSKANGLYFDNDHGRFASPHPDALDINKCERVVAVMESVLADKSA